MLQNLLVTEMVASSSISDRRKCCQSFLLMGFTYQLSMIFSFNEYAFSWGFHLLVMIRYSSSGSVVSSAVGLEVGNYEKTPHN